MPELGAAESNRENVANPLSESSVSQMKPPLQLPVATTQFDPWCLDVASGSEAQGREQPPRDERANLVRAIRFRFPTTPKTAAPNFRYGIGTVFRSRR